MKKKDKDQLYEPLLELSHDGETMRICIKRSSNTTNPLRYIIEHKAEDSCGVEYWRRYNNIQPVITFPNGAFVFSLLREVEKLIDGKKATTKEAENSTVDTTYPDGELRDTFTTTPAVLCEHANEVPPAWCACVRECYCKAHTCKRGA